MSPTHSSSTGRKSSRNADPLRRPLTIGTKLGPYEITDTIGAGGMGEVYKANDTRLGRTVTEGGFIPRWSADNKRLYYVAWSGEAMMVLDIETTNGLTAGSPEELFRLSGAVWDYEVTKDEQRFLITHEIVDRSTVPESVVLNVTEELKNRFEAGE